MADIRQTVIDSLRGIDGAAQVDDDLSNAELEAKLYDVRQRTSAILEWLRAQEA